MGVPCGKELGAPTDSHVQDLGSRSSYPVETLDNHSHGQHLQSNLMRPQRDPEPESNSQDGEIVDICCFKLSSFQIIWYAA